MRKVLALILVAVLSVSFFCLPAYAYAGHVEAGDKLEFNGATASNVFGDLLNWDGVVFGNANSIIDVEGTLAVGGNFTSNNGLSVNGGAYGMNPASTDDVAFLVNGFINIKGYGNVWGQTVAGVSEGNDYRLTNVTPAETTNGQLTLADSSKYFEDANATAYAAKAAVEALQANGVCESANGTYTFVGDSDADVLVYNVDDALFNSYLFDFTIAEGQTIVVNLTTSDKIELKNGAFKINGSLLPEDLRKYNRNIIINVVNSTEIEMTYCELYGILLAPDATLTGRGSSVCGTSILNGLTGTNGFELHVGSNDSFIPAVPAITPAEDPTQAPAEDPTQAPAEDPTEAPAVDPTDAPAADPTEAPAEDPAEKVSIRIDAPLKMAVAFVDGTVYYGGEMKEVVVGQEYPFQMCAVNWDNGVYDDNGNGLRGTVVFRMIVVHRDQFLELARAAKENPERYTVKGIDIIDNEAKTITINCDATDTHLETDVNNFFMAYRFHFANGDYNKKTGIENVINTPLESLSVNLPLGSTITCNAYIGDEKVDSDDVFIANNSGEGIYDDEYLTSVNDYTWAH